MILSKIKLFCFIDFLKCFSTLINFCSSVYYSLFLLALYLVYSSIFSVLRWKVRWLIWELLFYLGGNLLCNIGIYTYKFLSKHCFSYTQYVYYFYVIPIHLKVFSNVFCDFLLDLSVIWKYLDCFPHISKFPKVLSVTDL